MTRREEITQSAKNKYPYIKGLPQSASNQAVFIEAAEWADKTMIDKACDWLNQNVEKYESVTKMGYMPFSLIEDMINDFRKAMEE